MTNPASRGLCLALAALLFGAVLPAAGQTIRFLGSDRLPPGLTVEVLSEPGDTTPAPVPRQGADWLFEAPAVPGRWRAEPMFVVTIPERNDPDGIVARRMQTLLAFSVPAHLIATPIEVPLVVYDRFSGAFLDEIESLSGYEIFQRIQLSQQLALHFRAKLGAGDEKTRRMMQLWFDSLHGAILRDARPLRIQPDLLALLGDVFEGDRQKQDYILSMFADLRSTFWLYRDSIEAIARWEPQAERCDLGAALLADVSARHAAEPADALLRFTDADPRAAAQASLVRLQQEAEAFCPPG